MPLKVTTPPDGKGRLIGIGIEDMSTIWRSWGSDEPGVMQEILAEYLDYSGQNFFSYLGYWFGGPVIIPSIVENQYFKNPIDNTRIILEAFEQRNLTYFIKLIHLRLHSLIAMANTDTEAVMNGTDTINIVDNKNRVRPNTFAWNYSPLEPPLPDILPGEPDWGKAFREWGNGPVYNPIHPKVQERMMAVIDEIAERYSDSPAFGGVEFILWTMAMPWFKNLENGYGNVETHLFEEETGIRIPVSYKDRERFSKRYEWLMSHAKEEWVDWRCRKIHDLFIRMRDALVKRGPDLRLIIGLEPIHDVMEKGKDYMAEIYTEPGKFYEPPASTLLFTRMMITSSPSSSMSPTS